MSLGRKVSIIPTEGHIGLPRSARSDRSTADALGPATRRAIAATRQWLLDQQQPDGCWCAELEGDTILESETILLWAFLGQEGTPLARRAAAYLIEKQLPDGGWAMYPGGHVEISGSVKAYFALKLTGHDPSAEYMERARRAILAHGGADAVNSFTRFYLALLGQISYNQCPAVPPELVVLPKWFPVNLYAVSSWSRTIIVPLSIISAMQPVRQIEPSRGIRELFLQAPRHWPPLRCPGMSGSTGPLSWDRFFRVVEGMLKWGQRLRLMPWRRRAVAAAARWMLQRFEHSDGLGAIYPPIVWSIVALKCLGYDDESEPLKYCYKQLDDLVIDDPASGDGAAATVQVAGLGHGHHAAGLASERRGARAPRRASRRRLAPGKADHPPRRLVGDRGRRAGRLVLRVCQRVLSRLRRHGHGPLGPANAVRRGRGGLAGAAAGTGRDARRAEAANGCLSRAKEIARLTQPWQNVAAIDDAVGAMDRGLRWLLAMQNDDGGWGAFDRGNDRQFLCRVPFADHNAMTDPSTPDLTGRVLECLGRLGWRIGTPVIDRAVAYLRQTQQADGSWFGRWGVNYIYGAWQSLTGLCEVGVPPDDPAMIAGANWLLAHQQPGGGWGESPDSYEQPQLRGQGDPTASQTAWAVLGLLAAGLEGHPATARGIRYLVRTQRTDGAWDEPQFTGTGFPRVFYLRYHYYPIYFPLMALARWAVRIQPRVGQG